jgi:hypothetical protein
MVISRLAQEAGTATAMIFLPNDADAVAKMAAISGGYAARLLKDLWLSEVRLASDHADADASEEAIEWVLVFDPRGRMLPDWQGPADGVIPKTAPVTIRATGTGVSRLRIEMSF